MMKNNESQLSTLMAVIILLLRPILTLLLNTKCMTRNQEAVTNSTPSAFSILYTVEISPTNKALSLLLSFHITNTSIFLTS
jgi:hypothetical protein